MGNLTPEQIEAAQKRGANSKVIPKEVQVNGLPDLIHQLNHMVETNKETLSAIQQLTETIRDKEFSSGTDLSGLIQAVLTLRAETKSHYEPTEWEMIFERDQQRNLIRSGVRFKPVTPLMLN